MNEQNAEPGQSNVFLSGPELGTFPLSYEKAPGNFLRFSGTELYDVLRRAPLAELGSTALYVEIPEIPPPSPIPEIIKFASKKIIIDTVRNEIRAGEQLIKFGTLRFNLLLHFGLHLDKPQTVPRLVHDVWRKPPNRRKRLDTIAVNTAMNRLRDQLGDELGNPTTGAIRTAPREGYRSFDDITFTAVNELA